MKSGVDLDSFKVNDRAPNSEVRTLTLVFITRILRTRPEGEGTRDAGLKYHDWKEGYDSP